MVPDSHWGISTSRPDHPGACVHYQDGRAPVLVKGTDRYNPRDLRPYYEVEPSAENGLNKPTAFELYPRYIRLHRLRLYYPERYLGRLDEGTRLALCEELARLFPEA
jgi:hypothetical protein